MPRADLDLTETQTNQAPPKDKITCIEPGQGEFVYRYFNDFLDETATQRFEEHLLLCFGCQNIIFTLDAVEGVLAENLDEIIPPPVSVLVPAVVNAITQNREILTSSTDAAPVSAGYGQTMETKIIER